MIADTLHVFAVQPDLHWLNPTANLNHLDHLLKNSIQSQQALGTELLSPDLIVLPEMFTSGFTQKPEPLYGDQHTIQWMQAQARYWNTAVVGSIACEVEKSTRNHANNHFVNRLLFVQPNGTVTYYDKRHLFRMGGEHERYQAGSERKVVVYNGWRILLTVCYDLRFPVFCRNQQDYDVMLCVANWPASRRHSWRTLLQARAIENQAYVIGVNRVGEDGNGLSYQGDSLIVDMNGELMADGADGKEQVLSSTITHAELRYARDAFPVSKDADIFKLL